ncbi:MAG: hypothetical protein IIB38_04625, partial [Candidatus Hydrogenedentes bacterium]|nr:hypothetical protein [Candidatus Hydrogenedentota bacterium]
IMLEDDNKDLKNYVGSMQLTSEGGVQWVVNTVKLLQKTFFDLFYSRLMKLFTFWQVDQCLRQAPADIEQVVKDLRDLNKKIETHGIKINEWDTGDIMETLMNLISVKNLINAGWSIVTILWALLSWVIKKVFQTSKWLLKQACFFTKKVAGAALYVAQFVIYIVNHPKAVMLILAVLNAMKIAICSQASEYLLQNTTILDRLEAALKSQLGEETVGNILQVQKTREADAIAKKLAEEKLIPYLKRQLSNIFGSAVESTL